MKRGLKVLFSVGRLFSPLYGMAMVLRAFLYRQNVLRSETLPVPVISVGNLTMGGTGKTPMVLYVTRYLLGLGKKPAIVSRGYGGKARGPVHVVSNGSEVLLSPALAGDEPVMLAGALPGVPVLIAPRRIHACRRAVSEFAAEVIVMDDGFQHLAVRRDVDLVLFGAGKLLGSGRVFPGGELREPFSALKRAHAFVITGVDNGNRAEVKAFRRLLRGIFPEKPVFSGEYLPVSLLHSKENRTFAIERAKMIPLFGFAGIAHPDAFQRTLQRERFLLTGFKAFPDHHLYGAEDVRILVESALALRARALITTEKDFVKLRPFFAEFPILALKIELLMGEDFDLFLSSRLGRKTEGAVS
jgi:tetraacyldisaccharide 4'-kinase